MVRVTVPPPVGRGAVGIDLQGRTTLVESRFGRVVWGPKEGPLVEVRTPDGEIQLPVARRLLRARRAAPPNPRLHQEVGGEEQFTESVCAWLRSAIGLRTIRLLIEASG